jgi:hypothetical protein
MPLFSSSELGSVIEEDILEEYFLSMYQDHNPKVMGLIYAGRFKN